MNDTLISSIYAALSSDTDLSDVVSDRIYPVRAPQPTDPPYVVFSRITGNVGLTMDGASNQRETTIQVDIFSRLYSQAEDASTAIVTLLQGYSGTLSSTEVWFCELTSQSDFFEAEDRLYHRSLDFRIGYSIPTGL